MSPLKQIKKLIDKQHYQQRIQPKQRELKNLTKNSAPTIQRVQDPAPTI